MPKVLPANEKSVYIIDWTELFHNEMEHFTLSNTVKCLEKNGGRYFSDQ